VTEVPFRTATSISARFDLGAGGLLLAFLAAGVGATAVAATVDENGVGDPTDDEDEDDEQHPEQRRARERFAEAGEVAAQPFPASEFGQAFLASLPADLAV